MWILYWLYVLWELGIQKTTCKIAHLNCWQISLKQSCMPNRVSILIVQEYNLSRNYLVVFHWSDLVVSKVFKKPFLVVDWQFVDLYWILIWAYDKKNFIEFFFAKAYETFDKKICENWLILEQILCLVIHWMCWYARRNHENDYWVGDVYHKGNCIRDFSFVALQVFQSCFLVINIYIDCLLESKFSPYQVEENQLIILSIEIKTMLTSINYMIFPL